LILWIGEDEVAKGIVKIKSLNYHTEEFVARDKMIERVKELIILNPVLLS
jgi:histidyl-tRNA synthetase